MRERYGPWALVTGASAGIGAGFAEALAAEGLDLALVARRSGRLDSLARRLSDVHGIACRTIAADLAEPEAAARLVAAVADIDVGLVVSNAGTGWIGRFDLQEPADHQRLIQLHCGFTVDLTSRLLPRLLERGSAGLIVVSSAGGFIPLPYYAVYGGTKAFLQSWGEALAEEVQSRGVDVLLLAPGDTRTEFQEVAGEMSTRWSSVEQVVGSALAGLGRRRTVVPGWENRLVLLLSRFLPRRLLVRIAASRQRQQTPVDRR